MVVVVAVAVVVGVGIVGPGIMIVDGTCCRPKCLLPQLLFLHTRNDRLLPN